MSLSERLETAKGSVKPKFEQWIDTLGEVDRQALEVAAVDPTISTRAITDAIRAEGYVVSKDTVGAWRKAHVTR